LVHHLVVDDALEHENELTQPPHLEVGDQQPHLAALRPQRQDHVRECLLWVRLDAPRQLLAERAVVHAGGGHRAVGGQYADDAVELAPVGSLSRHVAQRFPIISDRQAGDRY
jgi:hypothetical protein